MPKLKPIKEIPQKSLSDSWSLWKTLLQYGDVEPRARDREFVPSIRKYLKLKGDGSLESQLRANSISNERLVEAMFSVTAPYGEMLRGVFELFEQAGARSGDSNLSVEFAFEPSLRSLSFDVQSFRKLQSVWQKATQKSEETAWNHDTIMGVGALLESLVKPVGRVSPSTDLRRWLEEYENGGRWPDWEPEPTVFASQKLDVYGRELWLLWTDIVSASRKLGPARTDLSAVHFNGTILDHLEEAREHAIRVDLFDPWLLRNLDSQGWSGNFLQHLAALAQVTTLPRETEEELTRFMDNLPRRKMTLESKVRVLVDILNLPIWRLLFSFAGYQLASSHQPNREPIHVWGELRTQFAAPKGKGRKKGIQPDFSLTFEPVTSPASSALVVEAKHYLQPARRSFADALEDYAKGRPNAQVVLVDYGSIGAGVIERIDRGVQDRCQVIEEFRPGNVDSLERFAKMVREAADKARADFEPSLEAAAAGGGDFQGSATQRQDVQTAAEQGGTLGTIRLRWEKGPADLDLHIWLTPKNGTLTHVFYGEQEIRQDSATVRLEDDCMCAPGEEIVQFGFAPEYIRCAVNNYSGKPAIASAGARIVSRIKGPLTECIVPEVGEGDWWLVFDYWPRSGRFVVWNALTSSIPIPTGETIAGQEAEA
jgi:hypothetical protein